MDQQNLGKYIEVDVVFINYKESLPISEPSIELEEISIINAENCESKCQATSFRDTAEGKSLSAFYNWDLKLNLPQNSFENISLRFCNPSSSVASRIRAFARAFANLAQARYHKITADGARAWVAEAQQHVVTSILGDYITRMRNLVKIYPNKQLRVTHWSVKSGDVNVFSFGGGFYPDLVHTYDRNTDYWFGIRMETAKKQLVLEYKSTRKSSFMGSNIIESTSNSRNESSDTLLEATLLDCDTPDQTPGPSNPVNEEELRRTSPQSSSSVYEYFSESPLEMYKAFTRFLRNSSSSEEE